MIYVTPFKNANKQSTGASKDSGFATLDAVVFVMGPPDLPRSKKTLIYGQADDRVIFSDFILCVDGCVTKR
jgi:hypothetical protein